MRGKLGFFSRLVVYTAITPLDSGWSGDATLASPLVGPNPAAATMNFRVNQAGTLFWSGQLGDGSASHYYVVYVNGTAVYSAFGLTVANSISVPADATVVFETTDVFTLTGWQIYLT